MEFPVFPYEIPNYSLGNSPFSMEFSSIPYGIFHYLWNLLLIRYGIPNYSVWNSTLFPMEFVVNPLGDYQLFSMEFPIFYGIPC